MFAEQNHLCNVGRRHHEEQFCEIILNLDLWFRRRCRLKKKFTHNGQRPITLANLEPSAPVS